MAVWSVARRCVTGELAGAGGQAPEGGGFVTRGARALRGGLQRQVQAFRMTLPPFDGGRPHSGPSAGQVLGYGEPLFL